MKWFLPPILAFVMIIIAMMPDRAFSQTSPRGLEITRNCNVKVFENDSVYLFKLNLYESIKVSFRGDVAHVTMIVTYEMKANNISQVMSRAEGDRMLERFNACSGLLLDN